MFSSLALGALPGWGQEALPGIPPRPEEELGIPASGPVLGGSADLGIPEGGSVGAAREEDLGIPAGVSWQAPGEAQAGRDGKTAFRHPLSEKFWERLAEDLTALERWRAGLLEVLSFARGRPQVFPRAARAPGSFYQELELEALRTWRRALDLLLALDGLAARYGEFSALEGGESRAAFLTAYAAYLASGRFAREWSGLSAKDPELESVLDRSVPALGVPAGGYRRLRARFRADAVAGELEALRARVSPGGFAALKKVLGPRLAAWERARREDEKALGRPRRAKTSVTAERALRGVFPVASRARFGEGPAAEEAPAPPLMLPPLESDAVTASSTVAHAIEQVRHWFRLGVSTPARPEALISLGQIRELSSALEPGDILLIRRERHLSEIGLGGYWHHAGLYFGSATERRRHLGGGESEERLMRSRPDIYQRSFIERSTSTPALRVLDAGADGVSLRALETFAAADSLAVLRPRADRGAKLLALERGFALIGRPHDFRFDYGSSEEFSSAELALRAYGAGASGGALSIEPEEALGRWSVSSNALARKFDIEFGTERQQLDWVAYIEGDEPRREARRSTLEAFRSSWRRPKWVLQEETSHEK